MEKAYYLIVERDIGGRRLRVLDDYTTIEPLVCDAADYEAGEFDGDWVGGLQLVFDASGHLAAASSIDDLESQVRAELATRAGWKRAQSSRARWAVG